MRIYTKAGDLAFKTFTFPDGQPHFVLETYEQDFLTVIIESAIKSPTDLFTVLLANDVLRQHGYTEVNLDIRYLMGARMDRAIDVFQPFTLSLVSRLVNGAGFSRVRVLDAHSETATKLIRNSTNILPHHAVSMAALSTGVSVFACPDKGAIPRTSKLLSGCKVVYCEKVRDMATGVLSGFKVLDYPGAWDSCVMIVDDICDGGGTFTGLAKELRKAGAAKVILFVTHGIFSKGLPLEGIDHVYTTDSYVERLDDHGGWRHFHSLSKGTVIPISMEKL